MYENLEHPLKQKHLMMIMPQSFSSSRKKMYIHPWEEDENENQSS